VGATQRAEGSGTESGMRHSQRLDHAAPEAHGVRIGRVECQPREHGRAVGHGAPLSEQRGLARARRRRDQRQLCLPAGDEQTEQRVARKQVGTLLGRVQLRDGEDGVGHQGRP
jgi:hypothetical protein